MSNLVEKNDYIKFDPATKESVTIKWQQGGSERSDQYVVMPYTVIGKPASGSLFIQTSLAEEFMNKSEKDESTNPLVSGGSKIKVDDAFQYGQDKDKDPTLRFLVYHNKANKLYQHRFIETTAFSNIGKKIQKAGNEYGGALWGGIINKGADLLKGFIGDYLHNF